MAFDVDTFKAKLGTTLKLPTKSVAAPVVKAATTAARPFEPSPSFSTAGSTAQSIAKDDIADTGNQIKLLNPMHKVSVRPAFNKEGQNIDIYGGPVVGFAHDVAARTVESIVGVGVKAAANLKSIAAGGKSVSIQTPFDTSRIGVEKTEKPKVVSADLSADEADKVLSFQKSQGKNASLQDQGDGKFSVTVSADEHTIKSSGDRAMERLAQLDATHPDRQATNVALASMEPVFDVLDATIVGDIGVGLAKQGLKATAYNPGLDKALQQYGLKGTKLTGSNLTSEINRRFRQKATQLIEAGDKEGLSELGASTNALLINLSGRGVPQLNKLGQFVQDASRLALQDAKEGVHLLHPMYPELAPEKRVEALPGLVEEEGQATPLGMSTRRVRRVGDAEPEQDKPFEDFEDVSTKILGKLKGKTTTSKQEILDFTNASDLKQPEKDLFHRLLADEGNTVNVAAFATKIKAELLPLKRGEGGNTYENVVLPDELRGPVADYRDHIYSSPIKTSAGSVHFGGGFGDDEEADGVDNYFAHSRVEDLPKYSERYSDMVKAGKKVDPDTFAKGDTRRIIELQSDLFQRGRLEREAHPDKNMIGATYSSRDAKYRVGKEVAERDAELSKLEPYRNTWHERLIREEVKQAAKDGKTKLQFPTGETAMKIEGLGEHNAFSIGEGPRGHMLKPEDLKVGAEVNDSNLHQQWIITDVLGAGKFKAVPKQTLDSMLERDKMGFGGKKPTYEETLQRARFNYEETFDISGKVDNDNPIYKFYEKEVGRYLKNKYDAKRIVDAQGVLWWEVDVKPEHAKLPVQAFGAAAGVQQDKDGNVTYNPLTGLLGVFGGIAGKITEKLSPELAAAIARGARPAELEKMLIGAGIRADIAKAAAIRLVKGVTKDDLETILAQEAAAKNIPEKAEVALTPTEEESYEIMAGQTKEWKYDLRPSVKETAGVDDTLASVFADLKGVPLSDVETGFTKDDLDLAREYYEFSLDSLVDHPGRALMKYVSRTTGELPEFTGKKAMKSLTGNRRDVVTSEWARRGDQIFQDLVGQELSKGGDVTVAQEMVDDYRAQKKQVAEIQSSFRKIRSDIQLQKAKDRFVESSKRVLAAEVARNVQALKGLVEAAERSGYRKGIKVGNKRVADLVARLKSRRTQITAIQKIYNLTDNQMAKIRDARDPRFMDKDEFDTFMTDLETKASTENKKNEEKVMIKALVEERGLKKVENLRVAMELPKLGEMNLQQLQEFGNALEQFKQDDIFLGPRMIQTIVNTDLGDVKTIREIREKLAEQSGHNVAELEDVRSTWTDKMSYDASLADRNPLYKWMVTEFTAKNMETEQKMLMLRRKVDELAKAARASRTRTTSDHLVPQDSEVFEWLSTPEVDQAMYAKERNMTPQELEYGEFVKAWYRGARDLLIEKGTLKKWREAYVTHITRSFLEQWKDDGFVKAIGSMWSNLTDQRVDFDAVGDTGEILGLEKFFKFSLAREGGMVPSKNVARVLMTYAGSFYKKEALDQMIPKLDAYVFSLQRPQAPGVPKDPTGLGVDGRLKKFVRQWINNKKGRQIEILIEQGGKIDGAIRAYQTFLAFMDLGFNVITGAASAVGGEMSNFIGLTSKEFATGTARSTTKKGIKMLENYPGVVGEPPFERLAGAANDAGDTLSAGAFYLFSELAYRQKGQFFLGSITTEEWETGIISFKRQAEIKLEMARFHPIDGMKSIAGATPFGKLTMMYKSWAEPFLFTARRNAQRIGKMIKEAKTAEEKAKVMGSREFKELFKLTVGSLGVWLFWNTVFGSDDPNDTSMLARLRRRVAQELATSLSALDPVTWTQFRSLEFVKNFAQAIEDLATLQVYKSEGDGYRAGDLKAPRELGKLFTPAIARQFMPATPQPNNSLLTEKPATTGGTSLKGKTSSPLSKLQALKKRLQAGNTNPALGKLKDLKKRLKLTH